MSKFTKYISKQFGNPNGWIGRVMTRLMNIMNKRLYKKTVALINNGTTDTLLDIGYGNGYLISKLYKKTNATIYGIDISEDCRRLAERRNKKAKKEGKLNLSIGDCCNLEFSDEKFDAITSINTIYFWSDTIKGLKEINRVLKPGSSFYNVVYSKEYLDSIKYTESGFKKFLPEDYIRMGEEVGYSSIRIEEIVPKKSYAVIYTK